MTQRVSMKNSRRWLALVFCVLAVALASDAVADDAAPVVEQSEDATVAVMPFIKGRDPNDLSKTLSCPFERFCYEDASLKAEADQILTDMIQDMLSRKIEQRVVPQPTVMQSYQAVLFDQQKDTPLDVARQLGRSLEVDYVLVGNVWRYRERTGSAYGVEKPASVAFALYLVNVEDGKPVWQGSFNETQQSLSENVLRAPEFFKRGAKWLTAEELAKFGIKDMMKSFPVH